MRRFTQLFRDLDETGWGSSRQAALERYFREAPPVDAAWALWLLWGNRLRTGISSKRLHQWASDLSGWPDWLIAASHEQVGDLAETASLLLPLNGEDGELPTLHEVIETRLLPLRHWDDRFQLQLLREFWLSLRRDEALVLNKLLTGGLRMGISRPLLIRALASCLDSDPAVLARRLVKKWEPTAAFFLSLSTERVDSAEETVPATSPPALIQLLEDIADDQRVDGSTAPAHTIDLVLVYAQAGQGRRASLFSHYTLAARDDDRLVPVTKVECGLEDLELREIDRWIKEHVLAKRGPVRTVPAELVFSVGFEGLRPSRRHKSGLVLRCPRVLQWQRDRTADDIVSLEMLRSLIN